MNILNRIKFVFLVLLISSLLPQCKEKGSGKNDSNIVRDLYTIENNKTSIISLISNPGNYNKKKVQIKGFVNFEFENCAIYLGEADYYNGIDKNAIWVQITKKEIAQFKTYNRKYVLLEGIFEMNSKGHEGDFSGVLNGLSKIKIIN